MLKKKKPTNNWLPGSDDRYLSGPALIGRDENLTPGWTRSLWVAMLWCASEVTDPGTRDAEVKDMKEIIDLTLSLTPMLLSTPCAMLVILNVTESQTHLLAVGNGSSPFFRTVKRKILHVHLILSPYDTLPPILGLISCMSHHLTGIGLFPW